MRMFLTVMGVLLALGAGTALATGSGGGGWNNSGGSAQVEYAKEKPGCGPDKTDGVAGNSGQHIGQPPKDQNRGDCPNPPGQQNKDESNKSSSTSSSSSSSSSNGKANGKNK